MSVRQASQPVQLRKVGHSYKGLEQQEAVPYRQQQYQKLRQRTATTPSPPPHQQQQQSENEEEEIEDLGCQPQPLLGMGSFMLTYQHL